MMDGNTLRDLIFSRVGLTTADLFCPREKSSMTPCIARDGNLAMARNLICIGCGEHLIDLLKQENTKHNHVVGEKEYQCASCGGVFAEEWDNEKAMQEAKENFTESERSGDMAIICDDCYNVIMPIINAQRGKQ